MRDQLFKKLLDVKSMTLSEYARTYLSLKYAPSLDPVIISTFGMDPRFEVKDGRIRLTKEAEAGYMSLPFVVLDTETTGITYYDNYIVEVAAVKVENGVIVDEFVTLIQPPIALNAEASRVNGITAEMLEGKPSFREIKDDLLHFLGNNIFVAHNAVFDWRFMNAELERNGESKLSNPRLCTIELSKVAHPGLPSYSLESLSKHFATKAINKHRALDDVYTTIEVMHKCLPKISKVQLKKLMS